MQCPQCKKSSMGPVDLVPDLTGMACNSCSGIWVDRTRYDAWRTLHAQDIPETETPLEVTVVEKHQAKLCPRCGVLLLPYRVGHGLLFSIDYCSSCGGVWFERNEWAAIKAKNLHDNLHDIVSRHWQTALRQDTIQTAVERSYAKQLGDNFAKVKEFRSWLREQPNKGLILAYLTDAK